MRHLAHLALVLTVASVVFLAPAAHAHSVDSQNLLQGSWVPVTDPPGEYLVKIKNEGISVSPPAGAGAGAWFEYQAIVTYWNGSALLARDDQGNAVPVDYTLTLDLHGNGSFFKPFQVEFRYVIRANGFVDTGVGHLTLSSDRNTLAGTWMDDIDGSTGNMTLQRVVSPSQ